MGNNILTSGEKSTRLLLIDPDIQSYQHLGQLLSVVPGHNFVLTWCADPAHALEALLSNLHDVAILDYGTDQARSHALLKKAVNQGCRIPVLVMTQQMDRRVDREAIRAGAADYLVQETFDSRSLERALRYAMDRKSAELKLARLAHYDPLTNVPNRILFADRLQRAIDRASRGTQHLALLFIDLDGFKQVNDAYGHEAGDTLIRTVAERLGACVRRSDSIARIGGDEFTVILEDTTSSSDVVQVARKIINAVSRPVVVGNHQAFVGCSIGIAAYPEGGSDVESLLKHADMAMYQAKHVRGSAYRFFTDKMNVEAMNEMYLKADLRRGLRRNEFELYYQPRIELSTGRTVGLEALVRWNHPTKGLVMPNEFVPVAEESGLIVPLGYWVIHQACEDLRRLDSRGFGNVHVAVNLSFRQFQDEKFLQTVSNILDKTEVDGNMLEFELTETTVMSNFEETRESMEVLTARGPQFSLDDFGTGYSSFSHLQRLPISAVKIDRSFVRNVLHLEDDATIVRAMIDLAHNLKLKVIAEGAETMSQVGFLRDSECDQVQGFVYSQALQFDSLCRFLQAERRVAVG